MAVANFRRNGDFVLVDIDAVPSDPGVPHVKPDAVRVNASVYTPGDSNDALLCATGSVIGTHAAVWATRD